MTRRMIRIPGPGEFRGEGAWIDFDKSHRMLGIQVDEKEEAWEYYSRVLPTKIEED